MGKTQKSVDLVLSLIPSLSKRDLDRVKKAIGISAKSVCEEKGHAMKVAKTTQVWFGPPIVTMVCTKCNYREKI